MSGDWYQAISSFQGWTPGEIGIFLLVAFALLCWDRR